MPDFGFHSSELTTWTKPTEKLPKAKKLEMEDLLERGYFRAVRNIPLSHDLELIEEVINAHKPKQVLIDYDFSRERLDLYMLGEDFSGEYDRDSIKLKSKLKGGNN